MDPTDPEIDRTTANRPSRRRVLRALGTATAAGLAATAAGTGVTAGIDDEIDESGLYIETGTDCDQERTDDAHLPFETDGYGGWGGHEFHDTDPGLERYPVVFVHGNGRDACDFLGHAEHFLERGFGGDELWSITFGRETSTHEEMREQLEAFVSQVLEYAGVDRVQLVGHSLGVTGIRYWMDGLDAHPDRYDRVRTLVGLAGANSGTWTCGPGCFAGPGITRVCDFISHRCADEPGLPLYELNTPEETPDDEAIDYYTLRGSRDEFFLVRPESPTLEGAENVELDTDHDGVRTTDAARQLAYEWLSTPLSPDSGRQDWQ